MRRHSAWQRSRWPLTWGDLVDYAGFYDDLLSRAQQGDRSTSRKSHTRTPRCPPAYQPASPVPAPATYTPPSP